MRSSRETCHLPRRRLVCLIVIVLCLAGSAVARAKPSPPVQVVVAGKALELKPPATVRDGKVIAPIRQCLSAIGARVVKQGKGQLAITAADGSEARLDVRARKLTVGGTKRDLSAPVTLRNGRHIGPVGDVFRALGLAVTWDSTERILHVHPCVTDVRVRADEQGVAVEITTSAPTKFGVNTLPDPPRIYIDAKDAVRRVPKGPRTVELLGVQRVRCDTFSDEPPVTRVVLDLEEATEYRWDVSRDGRRAQVTIGRPSATAPTVERHWAKVRAVQTFAYEGGGADVVALLSSPTRYEYDVRRKPTRVVLDLLDAAPGIDVPSFAGDDRLVRRVHLRPSLSDGHAQLVLDMGHLMGFQVVTADDPPRIAVRFQPVPLRERLIVVDPGHGGHDPGATGAKLGLKEKDANLDVGRRLNALLRQHRVPTIVTRTTDVFIPLYDRPAVANTANADIFLSIHHNAWRRPNGAHGTETYYTAQKDKALATVIHEHMIAALGRKDNGVRRSRFAVVRESRMPAALCEIVYINHADEEALVADESFRQRAARAIFDGLCQYVEGPGAPLEASRKVGRG
ncbi:MAG: N-acetylmuramoyl-L-alanine amidase [Armatimonadota bacterium]|jgi:N-acetylmuramoyl-L-alanine amidase